MKKLTFENELGILAEFLRENRLNWVLSGSCALEALGFFPDDEFVPEDIDVAVFVKSEQVASVRKLLTQQALITTGSYGNNEGYDNPPITLRIGSKGVKVNVWVNTEVFPDDEVVGLHEPFFMWVYDVMSVLRMKLPLQRTKDFLFWNIMQDRVNKLFFNKKK